MQRKTWLTSLFTVVLLALVPSSGTLATTEQQEEEVVSGAPSPSALAAQYAAGLKQDGGAARLLAAHGLPPVSPSVPDVGFDEAMTALYQEAGLAAPSIDPPEAELAASVAPVIAAVAEASASVREATAVLGPGGAEQLWNELMETLNPDRYPTLEDLEDRQATLELAAQVDMQGIVEAAAQLLAAMEGFVPPPGPSPSPSPAGTWTDPLGLVEIGGTSDDCWYTVERVLIIDLGGDDCYNNHAATATPKSPIALPVSVILEVGGNDIYLDTSPHANDPQATWSQAVGVTGIGLILDRWGNDEYHVSLTDLVDPSCAGTNANNQFVLGQGMGLVGVGALVDLGGDDTYTARNENNVDSSCHFNFAYTFAQAATLEAGAGLLLDDLGNDQYWAHTEEWGEDPDNNAHTNAQAASGKGIAVLVDKEGHDTYNATASSGTTGGPFHKGSHAYVFGQAATYATRREPFPAQLKPQLKPECSIEFPTINASDPTGGLDQLGIPLNCLPRGCPAEEAVHPGSARDRPCIGAVAALVDVLGDDRFLARPTSSVTNFCTVTSRAVAVAQGAAAWPGLALLNVDDLEGKDVFESLPDAVSDSCIAEGHSYVQGFAGHIMWDRFDDFSFSLSGSAGVLVGVLLSEGPLYLYDCPLLRPLGEPQPPWPPGTMDDVANLINGTIGRTCHSFDLPPNPMILQADDHFVSHARATNTNNGSAEAFTWAQGSAQGRAGPLLPPLLDGTDMLPIGILQDTGGNDTYNSTSATVGGTLDTDTYAQGSTVDGVGVLVDVGGHDTYDAWAIENGTALPPASHAQAYANGNRFSPALASSCPPPIPVPLGGVIHVQCTPNSASLLALGVFVDVFGWDEYSEAPERIEAITGTQCQVNGRLTGGWPLGDPLPGGDDGLGTAWWGTVLAHPCTTLSTPTSGSAVSIGLDWASDVNAK